VVHRRRCCVRWLENQLEDGYYKGSERVIVNKLVAKARFTIGAVAGSCAILVVSPAYANSAAAADISAPLRAAQAEKTTSSSDDQFRKLFNNWQSLEKPAAPALSAVGDAAQAGMQSGRRNLVYTARPSGSLPFGSSPFASAAISALKPAIPSRAPLQNLRLTSDFGMRMHPILGRMKEHDGIDLAAPTGTPVFATADGLVEKAEWFGGYGLCVQIAHGGSLETRYGHMSRLNVAQGEVIHKGDIVGFVGATGRATGPHLHYEVRVNGAAVNPIPYMQGNEGQGAGAAPTSIAANLGQ
jgi:murein DD-endopeptidase MepM/ murein hydrolase activator NlpD